MGRGGPVFPESSPLAHQKMSARGRQTTTNPIANTTAKAHASICRMPPATNPSAWKARLALCFISKPAYVYEESSQHQHVVEK